MINIVKLEIIAVIGYHIFLSSLVKYIAYICTCISHDEIFLMHLRACVIGTWKDTRVQT